MSDSKMSDPKILFNIEQLIFYPEFIGLICTPFIFNCLMSTSKRMLNHFVKILFTEFFIRCPIPKMINLLMHTITRNPFIDYMQPIYIGNLNQVCLYKMLSLFAITSHNINCFSVIVQKMFNPQNNDKYGYFDRNDNIILKIKNTSFNNGNFLFNNIFKNFNIIIMKKYEKYINFSLFELHTTMLLVYKHPSIKILEYMGMHQLSHIQDICYDLSQFDNFAFWKNYQIGDNIFFTKLHLYDRQILWALLVETILIIKNNHFTNNLIYFNKSVIYCNILFQIAMKKISNIDKFIKMTETVLLKFDSCSYIQLLLINIENDKFKKNNFIKLVKFYGFLFSNRQTNKNFYNLIGLYIINTLKYDQILANYIFQTEEYNKLFQFNFIFHEIYGIHFKNSLLPTTEILVGQYNAYIVFKEFTENYSSIEIATHLLTIWCRMCKSSAIFKYAIVIFKWIVKNNYFYLFDENLNGIFEPHFIEIITMALFWNKNAAYKLLYEIIVISNKNTIDNIIKYIKIAVDYNQDLEKLIEKSHIKNIYKSIKNITNKELMQSIINLLYYFQPSIFEETNSYISNKEKKRLTDMGITF